MIAFSYSSKSGLIFVFTVHFRFEVLIIFVIATSNYTSLFVDGGIRLTKFSVLVYNYVTRCSWFLTRPRANATHVMPQAYQIVTLVEFHCVCSNDAVCSWYNVDLQIVDESTMFQIVLSKLSPTSSFEEQKLCAGCFLTPPHTHHRNCNADQPTRLSIITCVLTPAFHICLLSVDCLSCFPARSDCVETSFCCTTALVVRSFQNLFLEKFRGHSYWVMPNRDSDFEPCFTFGPRKIYTIPRKVVSCPFLSLPTLSLYNTAFVFWHL